MVNTDGAIEQPATEQNGGHERASQPAQPAIKVGLASYSIISFQLGRQKTLRVNSLAAKRAMSILSALTVNLSMLRQISK